MFTIYERVEGDKVVNYEKIILALLQQCKDNGLTVDQTNFVLERAIRHVNSAIREIPVVI